MQPFSIVAISDNPDIRQFIIELKSQFTEPTHESLSLPVLEQLRASMEDLTGEDRGRRRRWVDRLFYVKFCAQSMYYKLIIMSGWVNQHIHASSWYTSFITAL